jgi:hypothetical protein
MTPEQQFKTVSKAIAAIPNPTLKAAHALEIMGKSATSLLPLMDNLDTLTKEADEFGLVMSTDAAEAGDKLADAMKISEAASGKVVKTVGSALAPMLTEASLAFARVAKSVAQFVEANKPLIIQIFKVGAILAGVGAAFALLGGAIMAAGAVLSGIAATVGAIGAVFGALLSPIGLVVAAVVGLGAYFVTSTKEGGDAVAGLGDQLGELLASAEETFKGIGDALKAGDIKLAANILWAALKVEWLKGTQWLLGIWSDWGLAVVDVFQGISYKIAGLMTDAIANNEAGWTESGSAIKTAWTDVISFLSKRLVDFQGVMGKVWAYVKAGIALVTGGDFNLENALAQIDVETEAGKTGVEAARSGREAEIEKQRGGEVAQIAADRQNARAALDDQQKAAADARRKAAADALKAGADELATAQDNLKSMKEQAAKQAAAVTKPAEKKKAEDKGEEIDKAMIAAQSRKVDVKGTFSAAAIRGLGAGDTANEILKESQKQTEELRKINRKAALGRQMFT